MSVFVIISPWGRAFLSQSLYKYTSLVWEYPRCSMACHIPNLLPTIYSWLSLHTAIHSFSTNNYKIIYSSTFISSSIYYPENGFAAFGCWDSRLKGKRRFIENWSLKINSLNSIKNCVLVKWLKSIIMLGPENEKCNPKMLIFFFFPTFLSNQTEH